MGIALNQRTIAGLRSERQVWAIIGQATPHFVFGNLSVRRDCHEGFDMLVMLLF